MTFCPSTLRRSAFEFGSASSRQPRGLCCLPPHRQHALTKFVAGQPPRVVAELLLQVAADGLTVTEALDLVDDWRRRLTPGVAQASGADHLPAPAMRQVVP